jgi:hypothetical protein
VTWRGTLAYRAAADGDQTIADDTETAIIFTAESYDHLSAWSASNPTRLTVPTDTTGYIKLVANGGWSSPGDTNPRRIWFRKNGSAQVYGLAAWQSTSNGTYFSIVSAPIEVSASDYFEVMVWQNNAAANPAIVGSGLTNFAMEEVSASFSGALVRSDANMNFPASNGNVGLDWTHEVYDIGGWWAVGLPRRLVVPAGVTHVRVTGAARYSADMEVGANDVNVVQLAITINGGSMTTANGACLIDPTDTASYLQAAWCQTPWTAVSAGDYFETNLFSNHTGSHQVLAHEETFMAIEALLDIETAIAAASTSRRGGGWAKQVERETKPCPKCFGDGFIHYVDPRAGNYQRMSLRACNHLGCRNGRVEVS